MEEARRERRRTWVTIMALGVLAALLVPPAVYAAVQEVKVKGPVKVKDSDGSEIECEVIDAMGLLQAEGSDGACAVRTFAGGGGFLGAGDCTASTEPAQGPLPNTVEVSNAIVTGIIITGEGTVRITSAAIGGGQVPLANFGVGANHPNEFVGLGNGLTVTAPLTFTGVDGSACNFVILGQ